MSTSHSCTSNLNYAFNHSPSFFFSLSRYGLKTDEPSFDNKPSNSKVRKANPRPQWKANRLHRPYSRLAIKRRHRFKCLHNSSTTSPLVPAHLGTTSITSRTWHTSKDRPAIKKWSMVVVASIPSRPQVLQLLRLSRISMENHDQYFPYMANGGAIPSEIHRNRLESSPLMC